MGRVSKTLFIFIFVGNLLFLDYYVFGRSLFNKSGGAESKTPISDIQTTEELQERYCLDDCISYVDAKIAALDTESFSPTSTLAPTETQVFKETNISKTKNVSYVPIPGSGSILNTNWTNITGTDFFMSKNDYPGLIGVYFEANMKLLNGNGSASLRIYDATHGIAVSGSEISTSSQTSIFVSSGNINLWDGYNNYRVQAKSLTSDTTVFESGRLKIVSEK